MLPAQLHRKVPLQFEGMEDVLTSSIFGVLRYVPGGLARRLLRLWADVPLTSDLPAVVFWPRYPTPAGFMIFLDGAGVGEDSSRGDTEPDVVIRTGEWLVLVEVKYRSQLDSAYDQLGREFAIGYRLAEREGRRFRLLVVTADVLPPRPEGVDLTKGLRLALGQVLDIGGGVSEEMIESVPTALRWVSWQGIYRTLSRSCGLPHVSPHNRRLLGDACNLLELRGLKPYSTKLLMRAMNDWDRSGISTGV